MAASYNPQVTFWFKNKSFEEQSIRHSAVKRCDVVKLPVVLLQMFICWIILLQDGLWSACDNVDMENLLSTPSINALKL